MPGIDFAALREQVSIRDVLKLLGFQPTSRAGTRLRGPCPLQCSDDTKAFAVDIKIDKFYCHRCHYGGNQLDLWCITRGLSIYPAAKDLCAAPQPADSRNSSLVATQAGLQRLLKLQLQHDLLALANTHGQIGPALNGRR